MSGEKTCEGHVTVALGVYGEFCTDSVCKNCEIKHYALSHYNAGLCRERCNPLLTVCMYLDSV